jgi:VWFA-related protein
MARPFLFVAALALLAPAAAAGQDAAQPVFKSGVDLVRFDVRVVDAAGRPITDIQRDEIEIRESGVPLPVVLFQRVSAPAGSYAEEAMRAATAEVSSNAAFPRGHLYILIFDQQHITPGNEQRARMAAEQFIRRRVRASDRVALYAVPGPGPQIGFGSDKSRAIEALAAVRGMRDRDIATPLGTMTVYEAHRVIQGDVALMSALITRMNAEIGDVATAAGDAVAGRAAGGAGEAESAARSALVQNARAVISQSDGESRQFLQRLADVISAFRDIEGRKTVVLFSEGFVQDNLSRELETVAAAAAQSYSVFYTVDLNQRTAALSQPFVSETTLASEIQARLAPLATLAVETDGAMIVDAAARATEELDKIADVTQDYYLVGFTPPADAAARPDHYRRVTVTVRRPGARVSARTGYAVAPAQPTAADRRRSIERLLAAPFVQQGLNVDYTTYLLKGSERGRQQVVLSLSAELPVRARAGDAADVVFVVRDARDGRVVETGAGTIPLPATARPGAPLGSGQWRVHFSVPPGAYIMRSVVREPGGLSGSADRRFDVRAFDGPDVSISDIVIASAISGLPVKPNVYTGSGLTAMLETYARAPAQLEGLSVRVDLRRSDDNTPVAMLDAELLPLEQDGTAVRRRAQLLMPLNDVAPGTYLARAVVRARGEVIGERTRQVQVLPGTAPAPTPGGDEPGLTWRPIDIVQGALARQYVAWLAERAKGTSVASAAALAAANKWEQLELELARTSVPGVAAEALKGLALFVREDYTAAAASLARAGEAAPQNALTMFFLGWAHEGAGNPRDALSAWRSAVHLDPTLVSAHLALAEGYLKIAERALAVQALRAGLAALPASPELQARLQQLERVQQ